LTSGKQTCVIQSESLGHRGGLGLPARSAPRWGPRPSMPARRCLHSVSPPSTRQTSYRRPALHADRPLHTDRTTLRLPDAAHRAPAPRLQIILLRSIRNTWMRTAISPCFASTATPSWLRSTCTASTFRGCATAARSCIAASLRRTSSATSARELRDDR
jgi:hypothetical protein